VDKQAIVIRALFALLSEGESPSEAALLKRFREVEADWANAPAKMCSQCGRPVNLRHHRCLYCGDEYQVQSAFEFLEKLPLTNKPALRPSTEHGITKRLGG
jgi:ribosomal protein L32